MAKVEFLLLIFSATVFDFIVGDPDFIPHPVQALGFYINLISKFFIKKFSNQRSNLLAAGFLICSSTIFISFLIGKSIELIYFQLRGNFIAEFLFVVCLASCLASRSLISSVKEISKLFDTKNSDKNKIKLIREKVQKIVSRDLSKASEEDLIRSTTESLAENSVDGIFGPLFWILLGVLFMSYSIYLPGPLSLGFSYKAISTLDSMIGYKYGVYKDLGFFSAKIEDFATFIPCRLVAFTLPFVTNNIFKNLLKLKKVFQEGKKYESPNSGISEAIFAFSLNIKLGGENIYPEGAKNNPIINVKGQECNTASINDICELILKLQLLWTFIFGLIYYLT